MRLIATLFLLALVSQGQPQPGSPAASTCADFPKNLDSCAAYTCTFPHPFTGETMKREIAGLRGDVCAYVEQMPNGGSMECSYTPAMRRDVATFFRALDAAQSSQTRAQVSSKGATSTTTVDGRPIANPLEEAMKSGACTVKGYGSSSPARGSAPAKAPAAAAAPAATGTASGAFTVGGKTVQLRHSYAFAAPDRMDRTKEIVTLVLSDVPVEPQQAQMSLELQKLMRANQLHAVSAIIQPTRALSSLLLYDPAYQFAVSITGSNRTLEIDTFDGTTVSGRLSTIRPGAFSNVPYEFSISFSAPIQRR
jgi:hypothetical protein